MMKIEPDLPDLPKGYYWEAGRFDDGRLWLSLVKRREYWFDKHISSRPVDDVILWHTEEAMHEVYEGKDPTAYGVEKTAIRMKNSLRRQLHEDKVMRSINGRTRNNGHQ